MASRPGVVATQALPAGIAIRPFAPEDSVVELTRLLHRAYASLARMGLNYTAAFQSAETTRTRVEHAQCFVAWDRGSLAGTLLVNAVVPNPLGAHFGKPEAASIHQLAVAPECQGRGIGALLLAHAERWVGRLGFRQVALDTAESAPQLVAFFVRRGYRSVATVQWTGKTYRSIVMSKELPLVASRNEMRPSNHSEGRDTSTA